MTPDFNLSSELHRTSLPQDGDLHLARVGQLLLDGHGDVSTQLGGGLVSQSMAVGDHADFATGLDGVGLLDAGEAAGEGFQVFEPTDVLIERFPPRSRDDWR